MEQPALRHEELVAAILGLVPGASEEYRAEVDEKAMPELLRALASAAYAQFEAHIKSMAPGMRVYEHAHAPLPGEEKNEAAPDEVRLEDVYDARGRAGSAFGAENPLRRADAADRASGQGIELREVAGPKPWPERCLLKCNRDVSVKKTARVGDKVKEYAKEHGPEK